MTGTTTSPNTGPAWRQAPTTADLIRETNRLTIEPRGMPVGMQVYHFAPVLQEMKLPLRPLQPAERWADGTADEQVFTQDGKLFATFVRRSGGHSYLDFSEHARELAVAHKQAKEQTAGPEALTAPRSA